MWMRGLHLESIWWTDSHEYRHCLVGAGHVALQHEKPISGYRSTTHEETPVVVSNPSGASKKVGRKCENETTPGHASIEVFITFDVKTIRVQCPQFSRNSPCNGISFPRKPRWKFVKEEKYRGVSLIVLAIEELDLVVEKSSNNPKDTRQDNFGYGLPSYGVVTL